MHAVMYLSSNGAELSDLLFGLNTLYIYIYIYMCVCVFVFCEECGCICMISICVADNQQ